MVRLQSAFYTYNPAYILINQYKFSHGIGNFQAPEAQAALDAAKYVGDEHVESFPDGLEHDQVQRNSGQSVRHAEHFSAVRLRRTVTIAFTQQTCHDQ